jgi:hypothetical protein
MMVVAYALMVWLTVEITTAPLGTANAARDLQIFDGQVFWI